MVTPYRAREIANPLPNIGDEEYFQAAANGKLLLKFCKTCQRYHHYPRFICPLCHSDATEWREASGRGIIYTYSISRAGTEPYAIGYVTLEEGPSMMTNFVDCEDLDQIYIGQKVRAVFKKSEDGTAIPMFTPLT